MAIAYRVRWKYQSQPDVSQYSPLYPERTGAETYLANLQGDPNAIDAVIVEEEATGEEG